MSLLIKQLLNKNILPSMHYRFGSLTLQRLSSSNSNEPGINNDPDAPIFDMPNPFTKEKQKCILCEHNIEVNYKNTRLLSQFQSSYTGRVYGRHITGLCKAQQERVQKEIIKAQNAGLMGYYYKDPKFLRDPELFDPEKPIRPHRF